MEVLLLTNTEGDTWETLIKPAKRAKVGTEIQFGDGRLKAVVKEELEHGGRIIEFKYDGIFLEILESLGEMPLPPYIKERLDDPDRYQTVYAEEMVQLQHQQRVCILQRTIRRDQSKRCSSRLFNFTCRFRNIPSRER